MADSEIVKSKRGRKPKKIIDNSFILNLPDKINDSSFKEDDSLILQVPIHHNFNIDKIISDIPFISNSSEVSPPLSNSELDKLDIYKNSNNFYDNNVLDDLLINKKFNEIRSLLNRSSDINELIHLRNNVFDSNINPTFFLSSESIKKNNYTSVPPSKLKFSQQQTSNLKNDIDQLPSSQHNNIDINKFSYIYQPSQSYFDSIKFCTIFDCLPNFLNSNNWPLKTNIHCWWCCFPFESTPIPIPTFYNKSNETFKVFGCFCSINCAYSFSLNSEKKIDISLLKFMFNQITCSKIKILKKAPPREALNIFGGPLNISQFRDSFLFMKDYSLKRMPFIFLSHQIQEISIKNNLSFSSSPIKDRDVSIPSFQQAPQLKRTKPLKNQQFNIKNIFSNSEG